MDIKQWGFIDSGKCSPSFNMALDEALMNWHSEGSIPPVIRFYGWDPATLSIGYFQNIERDINMDAVREQGLGFVRRPTGGRGVLHDQELTYSVIVAEDYPGMPQTVTESYKFISQGILEGFKALGMEAYFSVPANDEERELLKNPSSAVCFDAPSWYELVVEGRKVAGSAQTRQKGVILQHGSILLEIDAEKLFSLFKNRNQAVKKRLMESFHRKAVAINHIRESKIMIGEAKTAFKQGFERGLSITLEPIELSAKQMAYVRQLAHDKYESEQWNFKR